MVVLLFSWFISYCAIDIVVVLWVCPYRGTTEPAAVS